MKFIDPKTGWKTYAVCAAGIVAGIMQAFGYEVPGWVDWVLVFMGGAALRHGIQKQSAALTETVLDAVSQAPVVPVVAVEVSPLSPIK